MEAAMRKPQEFDPGSEYIDEIVESIPWWVAVAFRLFPRWGHKSAISHPEGLGVTP